MFEFGNAHCIFFAAVLHLVTLPPPEEPPQASHHVFAKAFERSFKSKQSETLDPTLTDAEEPEDTEDAENAEDDREILQVWRTAGVVYVSQSPLPHQVHVAVAVLPEYRGLGVGRRACELAVEWAMDALRVHRVQARIMSSPHQNRARSLFAALGFSHEGVHCRAVADAVGKWVDVTHMGVLDTNWYIRARLKSSQKSLWDELLERHQCEVEELLRAEEAAAALRRTSSVETIHVTSDPSTAGGAAARRGRQIVTLADGGSASTSTMASRASSTGPCSEYDSGDDSDAPWSGGSPGRRTPFGDESDDADELNKTWVQVRSSDRSDASYASDYEPSSPPRSTASFSSNDTVDTSFGRSPSIQDSEEED
ncbi:hypothetical protein BD414DRAFT_495091 [Trametes punicea]|nr:hypothetical protein BD414DRAFT_495091 [Trametes punicea]